MQCLPRLGPHHRPLAWIARRPHSVLTMFHGRFVCNLSILGDTLAIDVVRRARRLCLAFVYCDEFKAGNAIDFQG